MTIFGMTFQLGLPLLDFYWSPATGIVFFGPLVIAWEPKS